MVLDRGQLNGGEVNKPSGHQDESFHYEGSTHAIGATWVVSIGALLLTSFTCVPVGRAFHSKHLTQP